MWRLGLAGLGVLAERRLHHAYDFRHARSNDATQRQPRRKFRETASRFMATSPRLPKHLRAALGPEAGEELVTILDAIRIDHERAEARFMDHMARIDRRFDHMDQRFERVESRLAALDAKLGDVKADLMKWSFLFWCGAVASIAALAGVLR